MQATGNNSHNTYSLSIRLHADGFSFFTYNPLTDELVGFEHYTYTAETTHAQSLEQALSHSTLIAQGSYTLTYGLITGASIIVPLECFKKEEAQALFKLTHSESGNNKTYYNILPHLETALIFTIEPELEATLKRHFPAMRMYHTDTMLLEKMSLITSGSQQRLYAVLSGNDLFVFAYDRQKLSFANHFNADNADNTAYYLLSVWKGLSFHPRQDELILVGQGAFIQAASTMLLKFLQHVHITHYDELFHRSRLAQNEQLPLDLVALYSNII